MSNLLSPSELTKKILRNYVDSDMTLQQILELELSSWELAIRIDQFKQDYSSNQNIVDETFESVKTN